MCNRYSAERREQIRELALQLDPRATLTEDWLPHINIPPTSKVPVVLAAWNQPGRLMRWSTMTKMGLVFNARSETLTEKPMWKEAVAHRRCLMLATGFWEFETVVKTKIGRYFTLPDRPVFPMAALWLPADADQPDRCVMVTNDPNDLVRPYHDRMPTVMSIDAAKEWLSDQPLPPEAIKRLCQPLSVSAMRQWRSTPEMNRNSYQEPAAVLPWQPEPDLFG